MTRTLSFSLGIPLVVLVVGLLVGREALRETSSAGALVWSRRFGLAAIPATVALAVVVALTLLET